MSNAHNTLDLSAVRESLEAAERRPNGHMNQQQQQSNRQMNGHMGHQATGPMERRHSGSSVNIPTSPIGGHLNGSATHEFGSLNRHSNGPTGRMTAGTGAIPRFRGGPVDHMPTTRMDRQNFNHASTVRFSFELCPVCTKEMKDERVLPCSHLACGSCAESSIWSPSFVCPVCRHDQDVESLILSAEQASMEKTILGLIENTPNAEHQAEKDAWASWLGASCNSFQEQPNFEAAAANNTNGNDGYPGLFGYQLPESVSPFNESRHRTQPPPALNNNFIYPNQPKERQMSFSNVQYNDILFQNDSQLGSVKVPPLSPVVGGETRAPRVPITPPQRQTPVPDPLEIPNFLEFNGHSTDVPKCIHRINDYYCPHCRMSFCNMCLFDHQTHRYVAWTNAKPLLQSALQDIVKEAQTREKDIEGGFVKCKGVLDYLSKSRMMAEKEIEGAFKKIFQHLFQRKNQIMHNLHQIHKTKFDILARQMTTLKNAKQNLSVVHRGIVSKMDTAETEELILTHINGNDSLKRMDYLGSQLQPHEDAIMSFEVNMKAIYDDIDKVGAIATMASHAHTKVTGVNLKTALVNRRAYFTVRCSDHSGVKRKNGGDQIRGVVAYPGGKRVMVDIKDYMDGYYVGSFMPYELGRHTLTITLRGLPIDNTLYHPEVKKRRPYTDIMYPPIDTFGQNDNNGTSLSRGWGVCCDRDGYIYATERDMHCVLVFDPNLVFLRKFGESGDGNGQLNRPAGITIDHNRRMVIVVDKDNHRIQIFTLDGEFVRRFGRRGSGHGEFQYPWDVDCNSKSQIIVSDSRNHRVQMFDKDGNFLISTDETLGKCNFKVLEIPRGVCFDPDGNIYVVDFNNHHILLLSPQMTLEGSLGRYGDGEGQFYRPQGVHVDSKGYIFIGESKNNRIQVFDQNKKFFKMITSTNKQPFAPCDIWESPDGSYFIVDIDYGCLYKF